METATSTSPVPQVPADPSSSVMVEKNARNSALSTLTEATTAMMEDASSSLMLNSMGYEKTTTTADDEKSDDNNAKKSGVSFGTVRVHQHRLTLGDNPGVSTGIPLTLGWDVEDSEMYDLAAFERLNRKNDGGEDINDDDDIPPNPNKVSRLTRYKRELIASQNHTRDSIVQRSNEVRKIKQSRAESEADKTARRVSNRKKKDSSQNQKKKGRGIFGWFMMKR